MRKEIDARGEDCPKPFIMTKRALDDDSVGSIVTIVDNKIAKENVVKLINSYDLKSNVIEKDNNFYIEVEKKNNGKKTVATKNSEKDKLKDCVVAFTKDKLGEGNNELGEVLIKGYIYTLTELEEKPKTLLFLNGGILLTTGEAETIDDLKKLQSMGVEILSCGTCLDYYGLQDQLKVGEVANMYLIADAMNNSSNTITL